MQRSWYVFSRKKGHVSGAQMQPEVWVSYFDLGSSLGSALGSWHKFRAATVTVCGEVCRVLLGHLVTSWTVLTLPLLCMWTNLCYNVPRSRLSSGGVREGGLRWGLEDRERGLCLPSRRSPVLSWFARGWGWGTSLGLQKLHSADHGSFLLGPQSWSRADKGDSWESAFLSQKLLSQELLAFLL